MKKLTFIVPVYNVENYLGRCLNSLLNQNTPHSEYDIILVNDGSTDNSLELATSYSKEYSNIQIINQENRGASAARNKGFKNANSRFTWFVDSDDFITENCLKDLLAFAESQNLEMFGVGPSVSYQNDFLAFFKEKTSIDNLQTGKSRLVSNNFVIGIWSYIFENDFLRKNRLSFMEGVYFEDDEFIPRALFFAQRTMMILNFSVYAYITRPNSVMTTTSSKHIYDQLKVAKSLRIFSDTILASEDKKLRNQFKKKYSNMFLSGLNSVIYNKYKIDEYHAYIKEGINNNLYPIKFDSNNFKTFFLNFCVNNFPKLYYGIKIRRF